VTGQGLHFVHPALVHLLWIAVALTALLAWLELRGRDVLGRFLSAVMQRRLADRPTGGRIALRMGLLGASLALGVLALMRPQTRGTTETLSSRARADVMFALDVSKSMLAEDASPSRLARAKAEIDEMLDRLPDQRFGLIAFAGRAVEVCPLTPDRAFFRMVLRETDPRSASRGGTRIGAALRKAVAAFRSGAGAKLVVLITDGEDQGSDPLGAAKEAARAGVRVIAIGFGSEQGSQIFVTDPATGARSAVVDRATGQPVISRLDGELLRKVALATKGAYVPAGTSAVDLDSIVAADVEPLVRQEADAMVRVVPAERYPWAVLASLLCLLGSVWVGSSTGAGRREAA
jgi:Ca-activated chloride channel family protein